jgi:lipoprotein-releasing system permease protein
VNIPYELALAVRYLRVHRGRSFLSVITLISVAGVTVGTAALVIALSLMTGFEQDVRRRILRGSAHLQVLSSAEGSLADTPLLERIDRADGVAATGPVLFTPAMIANEAIGLNGYGEIHGVDPVRQARVLELPDDPLAALRDDPRNTVVLGADLAKKLAVGPGDEVRALVPRVRLTPFGAMPRSRLLRVVGTFRADAYPQDQQRAYVSLDTARAMLDAPGRASWIEIRLTDLAELDRRKAELARALGEDWIVMDLLEQNGELLRALNTEKLILFLAIGLIVVVAALNIVSTLILMVNDKVREIGTLTAMGAKPRGIAAVFVLQGAVIGLVGTLAGLALGAAASYWLDRWAIIKLNPDVYFMDHVPFVTRPEDAAAVAVVSLIVALTATLYPAWKAAKLEPVDAIRNE